MKSSKDESGISATLVRHSSDKKNGFTLDELGKFYEDAKEMGIPGTAKVEMWATWRQSAHKLRVKGRTE